MQNEWRRPALKGKMLTSLLLKYEAAVILADEIVDVLRPACERIEIAGEVRCRVAAVRDIDLVVIPKREGNLFGERGRSRLAPVLRAMVDEGRLSVAQFDGALYKRFRLRAGIGLDLFIVDPETWGVYLAQRTGTPSFVRSLSTNCKNGGRLQDHLTVTSGRVARLNTGGRGPLFEYLPTPEERDFLELCGGWVDPESRA